MLINRKYLALKITSVVFTVTKAPSVCAAVVGEWMRGVFTGSCKFSSGRHPKHAVLNDTIKRSLTECGSLLYYGISGSWQERREETGWYYCIPILQQESLCWDATCTDTYTDTNIYRSAVSIGHEARKAEEPKRRKYRAHDLLQVWVHRIFTFYSNELCFR